MDHDESHTLIYAGTADRETLWECAQCTYWELQFVECDGL